MKLLHFKIEKLFDLFSYDISLENEKGVIIITGPNGYGKTKILNIINSFFNKKFSYFQKLIFKSIELNFTSSISIFITKKIKRNSTEITFEVFQNGILKETFIHGDKIDINIVRDIDKYTPLRQLSEDIWVDRRTDEVFTYEEALSFLPEIESDKYNKIFKKNFPIFNEIISKTTTHLIQEQRLLEHSSRNQRNRNHRYNEIEAETKFTIYKYANILKEFISQSLDAYFTITQNLDSSFPKRLLTETKKIKETEYNSRFKKLREKQEKLRKFGVSDVAQEETEFNEENAKVLLVYLNDAEKKLKVFDELIERLELFTDILNERRFTHKSIKIDKEKGFSFFTEKKQELELTDLSSGEQNEVVLLYELIFNSKPNTLILIDEPEISLHVAWQREFLNDLLKIIELQKINVIIATHSPAIINNFGELTYSLYQEKEELVEA